MDWACTKTPYSKREAREAVNRRTKGRQEYRHNRPKFLRAYHCDNCDAWHLTHEPLKHPKPKKKP